MFGHRDEVLKFCCFQTGKSTTIQLLERFYDPEAGLAASVTPLFSQVFSINFDLGPLALVLDGL